MPISVAFIAASAYAVAITRRVPFAERISRFSAGAADPNVLLMIWIFVLAGAFAESAFNSSPFLCPYRPPCTDGVEIF